MPPAGQWYRWHGNSLELRVRARTRCRNEGLDEPGADGLGVRVNAPPVEGKANQRLLLVLADAFGVARTRVKLVRGTRSRRKWVRIERPGRVPEHLQAVLRMPGRVEKRPKGV